VASVARPRPRVGVPGRFRLRRLLLLFGGGGVALLLGTAPLWGPPAGRQIEWLEVRRVEVTGTRFLAPHEVLESSGIALGHHLLDDRGPLQRALLAHPAIASAEIIRKPPHTLRVRIDEKRPIAFIEDGTLRAVDGTGAILPFDPALVPMDLPIIRGSLADTVRAPALLRAIAETERLTALDPALMREISEIRLSNGSDRVIVLTHALGEVVVPFGVPHERIVQIRSVFADVEQRFPRDSTGAVPARLDLRFEDQIVVRPLTSRELL